MPTKVKPKIKQKTQYTRITIDEKLKRAIEKVQENLPLYSTNDVINYLISLGYKQMEKIHNQTQIGLDNPKHPFYANATPQEEIELEEALNSSIAGRILPQDDLK